MTSEVEGKLEEIKRWEYFKRNGVENCAAERSGQMRIAK